MTENDLLKLQPATDQNSWRRRIQHNFQVHPSSAFKVFGSILLLMGLAVILNVVGYHRFMSLVFAIEIFWIGFSTHRCGCGTFAPEISVRRQLEMMKRNYKWILLLYLPLLVPFFVISIFPSLIALYLVEAALGSALIMIGLTLLAVGLSKNTARQKAIHHICVQNLLTDSQLQNCTDDELHALFVACRAINDFENADAISKLMLYRAEALNLEDAQ